jgi:proteic killer suppression protein
MIVSTRGKLTEAILNGTAGPKGFPPELISAARRKLNMLVVAVALGDLRIPPGNRLEAVAGDRKGQHSIRINDQWRVCFRWTEKGAEDVEIVDYH